MATKKNNTTIIGQFKGKCCDSNVLNNNEMFLSRDLFENLFNSEDYKRAMQNRYYIGFLGHPKDPGCMDFRNACIVMTECHIEPNGEIVGTFDLIDTPVGRTVKAFIDAGVIFGISIRGAGDVENDGTVDPETFVFRGFDLVTFPAYDDAVPKFTEIAASTDLDSQVKYKKVCSVVKKNLQNITSCEALDVMQSQFSEHSKEYSDIEDRKSKLNAAESTNNNDDDSDDEIGKNGVLLREQVEGMTNLYLEQVSANNALREELAQVKASASYDSVKYARKVKSLRRINADQIDNVYAQLNNVEASKQAVTASYNIMKNENNRMKKELQELREQNLKYVHKIEANSKIISSKESAISNLEAKLRKTVTASSEVKKRTSNLDERCKSLQNRIEAAEQLVLSYQQAYANMYANALGVRLDNLEVTAQTSVSELQKMITGGTSTANMSVGADFDDSQDLDFENDIEDVVDSDYDDSDIISM